MMGGWINGMWEGQGKGNGKGGRKYGTQVWSIVLYFFILQLCVGGVIYNYSCLHAKIGHLFWNSFLSTRKRHSVRVV